MPLWKCSICNLVLDVEEPPEKCPKCGAPREKFKQLSNSEAKLIVKSRKTNYLHMKALTLLRELLEIAEEGIRENLDPPCMKIFNEERSFALLTIQKIMAELENHAKKGKWG